MKKLTANDPETRSADIVAENLGNLEALIPEAFTEGKIDFEVLKQLLGDAVDEREEKYGLNWHGKRRARQLALTPSTGALRPCPEESVDWDTTKNLMIEGDNLEVLKLLQKSYAGKVKLIYIDPPYNTGKNFIYPDDYRDNIRNYLELTGQVDGENRKLSSNTDASGRFHTDWLKMMYPRLKLARNLLNESGAIFISIDDTEIANIRKMCDEIFGEENFIATFIWQKRTTRENRKIFSFDHDFIICSARNKPLFEAARKLLPITDEVKQRYSNPDNDHRGKWQSVSLNAQAGPGRRKEQFYSITTPGGRVVDPPPGRCWIVTEERMDELIADNRVWFGVDGNNVPRQKVFYSEARDGLTPHTLWTAQEVGTNDSAKKELTRQFDGVCVFDTPKPVGLLERIVQITTGPGDIALDFFAGSAPLAEATARVSESDGAARRLIVVQLPEPIDDSLLQSDQIRSMGLSTIAEITKERLRRAGRKIRDENPLFTGDLGFRVFKLDTSNIRTWEPDRENLEDSLIDGIDHVKPGRSQDDILYELLLKLGHDLCVPIETQTIAGKTVRSIGTGKLIACLDEHITQEEVEPLALGIVEWHKQLLPIPSRQTGEPDSDATVIFRDSAFEDDVAKTNLAAILEQHGLDSVRSL